MAKRYQKLIDYKPELMTKDYFFKICRRLSIPTDNEDLIVSEVYFNRLTNNKDIIIAEYNAQLYKMYKEQVTKVKNIETNSKRADNIQKQIENDFKARTDDIREREKSVDEGYSHELFNGFTDESQNLTNPLKNAFNKIRPSRISYEKNKMLINSRDAELNALYNAYDMVNGKEVYSSLSSKAKQIALNRLNKKIKRLQAKQSKAFLKQNKIINKNAQKYIEKRYRQFDMGAFLGNVENAIKTR